MKSCQIICCSHLPSFFNFATGKRLKKMQGTHILDRLEIVYRIVYENNTKTNFTLTLISVHLAIKKRKRIILYRQHTFHRRNPDLSFT